MNEMVHIYSIAEYDNALVLRCTTFTEGGTLLRREWWIVNRQEYIQRGSQWLSLGTDLP